MADKNYVVSLTVDDSGAVAAVNQMTTALDKADNSTQSLKAQLRQMQQELSNLDPNTEEFQKLSLAAGELKDKINDASEAIKANAGSAFEQASGNASLLTERLLNLDFEGAAQSAKTLGAQMKTLKFGDLVKGVKDFASGLKSMATAMVGNPVFLALTAIVLAITAIGLAWQKAEKDAEEATMGMVKAAERAAQARALQDRDEIARAQGAADKIYEIRIRSLTQTIKDQKKLVDEANAYFLRGEEGTQEQITAWNAAKQKLDEAAATKRELYYARKQQLDTESFELERKFRQIGMTENEKAYDDLDNMFEDQIKKLQALGSSAEDIAKVKALWKAEEAKLDDKFNKEAAEKAKERRKKEKEQREHEVKFIAELYAEQDAQIEANNKALADRLAAIWQHANELSRAATQEQAGEIKAIQDELEIYLDEKGKTAQKLELQRLQDAYFEKKTLLENANKDTTAITEKYEAEQDAIKKKYADEDAARQQELTQKKIQFAGNALNAIAGLADAFAGKDKKNAKRNFQISKAFSIAQAGVNTALAATSALALKPSESLFPGQRFVEMGLAIAAGVAQIAKISSTKFNESGGDSGGGGGSSNFASMASSAMGSGGTVHTFNAMNLAMLQNRPEQTPKAYVLAQDVSSAVEARDKVRDLARIN